MGKQDLVTLHIPREVADALEGICEKHCFGKWTYLARRILALYVREQTETIKGGKK
jgi:hypothetical protein